MKRLFIFIVLLIFPLNVLAYSEYIIPGGETIGIDVRNNGIVIMGFYKVEDSYINQHLKEGDSIISVGNVEVNSVEELTKVIEENITNE